MLLEELFRENGYLVENLDPELMEQVKDKYPHLLEESYNVEEEEKDKIVNS
jgi:hypothetical protein|tara:strand:- start:238 stop:390 length:153 start_codon:yes stop_codon:yes gene_type:complete